MIDFACPSCGNVFRVDDALAGKQAKCRACGHRLTVPPCLLEDDVAGTLDLASLDDPFDALFPDGHQEFDAGSMPAIDFESPPKLARRIAGGHQNNITQKHKSENKDQNVAGKVIGGVIGILVAIGALWYFFGGGLEQQAAKDLHKIQQQVAADMVEQYHIARASGSAMDAYARAGLVAEAYLQAKDEVNYKKWKQIERQEGLRAGMPSHMLK